VRIRLTLDVERAAKPRVRVEEPPVEHAPQITVKGSHILDRDGQADFDPVRRARVAFVAQVEAVCVLCLGGMLYDLMHAGDLPICAAHWGRWLRFAAPLEPGSPCTAYLILETSEDHA
jgi:hypothetical protein